MRLGVDEAGKGPVLGPMVAAAVGVPDPGVLPDGVADSKRLAPERRERLARELREDDRVTVGAAAVSVERIDAPDTDMNTLTVEAQATALDAARGLCEGAELVWPRQPGTDASACGSDDAPADGTDEAGGSVTDHALADADDWAVLADAGDTSESRFARRLREACAGEPGVEARHGADDADPVVAAASVVAKVERDARVAALAGSYGEVGSGYPSDPTTREFLAEYVREHGELPPCARESWQTCSDVLAAAEQSGLEEF